MPAAEVILKLQSQVAPQIAATVSAYQQLSAAEQKAAQSAATYAKTQTQVALNDQKVATEAQRTAVQVANVARAEDQAALTALRLANAQARVGQSSGLAGQFTDGLKSGLLGIVGPAAAATATIAALKGALDLTVAGENVNRVERGFQNLARQAGQSGDAILSALRKASGGEISDLNLELATDKGLLLGVANTAQQFADIMEVARDRAAKMGITTTQAYDDITTGIGRESPRILDNLGIIVDADAAHKAYAQSIGKTVEQLSKAERIEALRNAVIAQGKSGIDAATTAANDQANGFSRLSASWDNIKNKAGAAAAQGIEPFVTSLSGLINASDGSAEGTRALVNAGQDLVRLLTGLPALTEAEAKAQQGWTKSVQDWIIAREVQIGLLNAQPTGGGGGGTFEFADVALARQATEAQLRYADSLALTGVQARAAQQAAEQKSTADKVASIDAQTHGIAEAHLAQQAQDAARALIAAGPAGARTAALLAGSSSQVDILTAAYYRLASAQGDAVAKSNAANQKSVDQLIALRRRSGSDTGRGSGSDAAAEGAAFADVLKKRNDEDKKAAADAARLQDAQNSLNLARAKTSAQKIAELQRQQAATSDPVEKLRLQAQIEQERNSAAKSHTSELDKQLKLNESNYDSIEKQKQAVIDLAVQQARNRLDTLKDQDELKKANAILASSGASADLKARAAAKRDLILAEEAKRNFEIGQTQATAGGTIINGKLFQSVPGGGGPLAPAPGQAAPTARGGAAPGAAAAAAPVGSGRPLVITMDGKEVASIILPYAWEQLDGAIQHARVTQGG